MDSQQKGLLKKVVAGLGLGLLGLMIWAVAYDQGMNRGIEYQRSLNPVNRNVEE